MGKNTESIYLRHDAKCETCLQICTARNAQAWAHIHATHNKGHKVRLDLRYMIKARDEYKPPISAEKKKAESWAMREESRVRTRQFLGVDHDVLCEQFIDLGPDELAGCMTREIGRKIGVFWTGKKTSIEAHAIARAMRECGYELHQKSRRGRPTWLWRVAGPIKEAPKARE